MSAVGWLMAERGRKAQKNGGCLLRLLRIFWGWRRSRKAAQSPLSPPSGPGQITAESEQLNIFLCAGQGETTFTTFGLLFSPLALASTHGLFCLTLGDARQLPHRPTACQSKLLLALSSSRWHRHSLGMELSQMERKKEDQAWRCTPLQSHQPLLNFPSSVCLLHPSVPGILQHLLALA